MMINRTSVGAARATSLLPAKPILAVLLSVLLIVSLFPMIQPAYGEHAFDGPVADVADTAIDGELSDDLAPEEGVDGVEGDDAPGEATEGDDPAAGEGTLGDNGSDGDDPAVEALAAEADTQAVETDAEAQADGEPANNRSGTIFAGTTKTADLRYTNKKSYTLTVEGTLEGTIYVTGGATLTINGNGTIRANKQESVITVDGGGSKLILNSDGKNVKITNGKGSDYKDPENQIFNGVVKKAGGGILVKRGSDGRPASLEMNGGIIHGNQADAGGGIFVDRTCSFAMTAGTVGTVKGSEGYKGNVALDSEGGGIFTAAPGSSITAGRIAGNRTNTNDSWGGGGIFVEVKGSLTLGTALITNNTANGLGGGLSGCPHAFISVGEGNDGEGSIGTISQGAAIYGNHANKTTSLKETNKGLWLLSSVGSTMNTGDVVAYEQDAAGFTPDKARDFYCVRSTMIYGQDSYDVVGDYAWTGRLAAYGKAGVDVSIKPGEYFPANEASLGLTAAKPKTAVTGRAVEIVDNFSNTHGGGIGCNGTVSIGSLPKEVTCNPFKFSVFKNFVNSDGDKLELSEGLFSFSLYEKVNGEYVPIGVSSVNDASGKVEFELMGERYVEGMADNATKIVTLYVKEDAKRTKDAIDIVYDDDYHEVEITIKNSVSKTILNSVEYTVNSPSVVSVALDGKIANENPIVNTLNLWGSVMLTADKYYYSDDVSNNPQFSFAITGLKGQEMERLREAPSDLGCKLGLLVRESSDLIQSDADRVVDNGESRIELSAKNGGFDGEMKAEVLFPEIAYNKSGYYWYAVREVGDKPGDPTVYVLRVSVEKNGDGSALVARVSEVYYAESLDATELTKLAADEAGMQPTPEFHNNAEAFSLAGYRINALSGAPVSQKCLVDPKIIKQLEGRTLTPGEFSFQLIEVNDYADTTGTVISETSNDADGMVDFDAAANKADPGWEPSCLLFTQPGLYKYRVIEDPKQQGDPSVAYSQQVITFTVQVDLNDGVLAATDMYYGYLNEAGENVRYKEQYTDWETKELDPAWSPSINDYADLDTSWHPIMTNRALPMDLAVRKTSVLDRTEGLEGATYALYLVNSGGEADIRLANATSDAEGWLYFEDVALKCGNLYYFMEEAAPAGHTVSKFRSKYFYLVPDATAPNGYVMQYADGKDALDGGDDLVAPAAQAAADAPAAARVQDAADDSFGGNAAAVGTDGTATAPVTGKDGALLFVYEADGGVADEATYVEFNKLDTRNHEWVEGAKLSIVEKDTGQVVNAWVSDAAPEVLQKALNVDTVYILREDEAPEGYEKAGDVEFRIDAFGAVEILSGTENGNAELSGSTITLYDTRIPVEDVVTETRERVRELPTTGPSTADKLAKTGDTLPLFALGLAALVALAVLVMAARRSRKRGHHAR